MLAVSFEPEPNRPKPEFVNALLNVNGCMI